MLFPAFQGQNPAATNASRLWVPTDLGADLIEWWNPGVLTNGAQAGATTWTGSKAGLVLTADAAGGGTKAATSFNSVIPGVTFLGATSGNDTGFTTTSLGGIPVGTTPGMIFILQQTADVTGIRVPVQIVGSSGHRRLITNANESLAVHDNTISITDNIAAQLVGAHVVVGGWLATTMFGWIDGGGLTANGGAITLSTGTALRLRYGAGGASGTYTNEFEGILADVLFTNALATGERQKLEGWLAHKAGIQAQLVGGHPYISAPPRFP